VSGLRDTGYSLTEIGLRLGVTRQAVHQRWQTAMTVSGAAAATGPEPDGSGPVATADDVITLADLKTWERQLASTGTCAHPVKLHGRVTAVDLATGEAAPVYDTASEPGGVLHVACGNRRESRCPACSQVYKRDTRQLVRGGLTGGKGVPESVATHPCVFATFTAPSFGRCTPAGCAARASCPAALRWVPFPVSLVLATSLGTPLSHSNFRQRHWLPALAAVGLEGIHFHDLRHTGNQLTANAGANLRELMARMGHDSERAALIYLHSSVERQRALADKVGMAAAAELPPAGPLTWAPRPRLERGTYRLGGRFLVGGQLLLSW
jgi:hypothetical protein